MISFVLLIASSFALGFVWGRQEDYPTFIRQAALVLNAASIVFNGAIVAHNLGLL